MPEGRMRQNEIFQESGSKFLNVLQCVIITSLWIYRKLQNATKHEMHAVFNGIIRFTNFHSYWYYGSYALLELAFTPFHPLPLMNSPFNDDGIICRKCIPFTLFWCICSIAQGNTQFCHLFFLILAHTANWNIRTLF